MIWSGPVVSTVAWKTPKLSLVLDLGCEIMLGWCCWGSPLPPCIPLLHMPVLAAHPQCWLGPLFPVYDFLTPHTYGPTLLLSCGSDSTCKLVINGPWKPARFLVQPACLPTVHRIFTSLLSWGSAYNICWPLYLLGLGCYQLLQTPLLLQMVQIGPPLCNVWIQMPYYPKTWKLDQRQTWSHPTQQYNIISPSLVSNRSYIIWKTKPPKPWNFLCLRWMKIPTNTTTYTLGQRC